MTIQTLKGYMTEMFHYHFTGRVLPERCAISLPKVQVHLRDVYLEGTLTILVDTSQIHAVFSTPKKIEDVSTLKNYVEEAIRSEIDALGFIVGCGYDVEILQLAIPFDRAQCFGVGIPALQHRFSNTERDRRFLELAKLFADPRGRFLQRCFSDLREAIKSPSDSGLFCYRAIETLARFFLPPEKEKMDTPTWNRFRSTVGVEESAIRHIQKNYADPRRHANVAPISDSEREKVFKTTWGIVENFIAFAQNNYEPDQAAQRLSIKSQPTRDDG